MQGEVRQFFVVDFVQRTDRMNLSVPRLHRVPRELDESGLVLGRARASVFGDSERAGFFFGLFSGRSMTNLQTHLFRWP